MKRRLRWPGGPAALGGQQRQHRRGAPALGYATSRASLLGMGLGGCVMDGRAAAPPQQGEPRGWGGLQCGWSCLPRGRGQVSTLSHGDSQLLRSMVNAAELQQL